MKKARSTSPALGTRRGAAGGDGLPGLYLFGDGMVHAVGMKKPSPFPARIAVAFLAAAGIMLTVPTLSHLLLGGPNETPLAWSSLSLACTALAAVAGVTLLAWRPPSGWATVLAVGVTAAAMTLLPISMLWDDRGWWGALVFYLVVYGVYFAIVPALMTAAIVLHGRHGLRLRRPVRASN